MKKIKFLTLVITLLFITGNGFALTGRQIMEKNDALKEAKSARQDSVLLINKGPRKEKKEFSGVHKKYGKKTRKRIRFSYPTRMEFLIWDKPGADSLQWIKLSSGKVRKIASSDKGKPWANSHFYYDDIADKDIDDYKYKLIGNDVIDGTDCYKVESVKKKGTKVYSKNIVYVGKDDYVIRKIDFFERGSYAKSLTFYKIEKISGIYTPRKAVMERADKKGKSIMYIRSVEYNVSVSDSKLKKESF